MTGAKYCSCGHVIAPFYRTCPACEGARNRERCNALRAVVLEVKATAHTPVSADHEAYLKKQLHDLGHPDVSGLLAWVEVQRAQPSKPTRSR